MADGYLFPAIGGGNDDGSDTSNPWTTWQRAIDGTDGSQPDAGDTVFCRGTAVGDAAVDMDGNSGTIAGGFVKFIGVNASWGKDGTKFFVDGDSSIGDLVGSWSAEYIWIENFEFANATDDLFQSMAAKCVFVDCIFHDAGDDIFVNTTAGALFINCKAYNAGNQVAQSFGGSKWLLGAIYENADGIDCADGDSGIFFGVVLHDNGTTHIANLDNDWILINNVIDGGAKGDGEAGLTFTASNERSILLMNRLTNLGTAIDFNDGIGYYGWNVFDDVTTAVDNGGQLNPIPLAADADTNEIDPDASDGYNGGTGGGAKSDFNLKEGFKYCGDGVDKIPLGIGSS